MPKWMRVLLGKYELWRLHRVFIAELNDDQHWMTVDWYRRSRRYADDVQLVKDWVERGE